MASGNRFNDDRQAMVHSGRKPAALFLSRKGILDRLADWVAQRLDEVSSRLLPKQPVPVPVGAKRRARNPRDDRR